MANTETDTQSPCPKGTYNNGTGAHNESSCVPCEAGTYCPSEGMTETGPDCDGGFYCAGQFNYFDNTHTANA